MEQTGNNVSVKKEKVDESEINMLAAEMAEKNRQKMLSNAPQIAQQNHLSQQALARAGGQQMITYYFNRDKDKNGEIMEDSIVPKKVEEKKKGVIDEDSVRGRFGWTSIHNIHIPYLLRRDEKYCAVRMVEMKLLNKYLSFLPQEITTCINVRSYFITESESRLLNEINTKHCELQFGRDYFTTKDLVVKVSEAKFFFRFLDTCFKKLVQKSLEQSEFCGFVRINGESVVPYTVKEKVKYVPLFYFEGETDTLKLKAERIDNWELAYLKFCCKVQGIRNELFASDTCAVVSLDDVKQYFPKDTQFEDWWPQKTAEPMRVVANPSNAKTLGSWTQRPQAPAQNTQNGASKPPAQSVNTSRPQHNNSNMQQHLSSNSYNKSSNSTNQMNNRSKHPSVSIPSTSASAAALSNYTHILNSTSNALLNTTNSLLNTSSNILNNNSLNMYPWLGTPPYCTPANLQGMNAAAILAASITNDQLRRLPTANNLTNQQNLSAALAVAAQAQQQHAAAAAVAAASSNRNMRNQQIATSQANRHSSSSKTASQMSSSLAYNNLLAPSQRVSLDAIMQGRQDYTQSSSSNVRSNKRRGRY